MKQNFNPTPLKFIIFLGFVSLWADVTYEGARSIIGPYLATLGANATMVGTIVGLGELLGYGLRFISGYLSDKTGKMWLFTVIGYTINLLAVPLLVFAGNWQIAAILVILERFGKAIRVPPRDAMLSYATKITGRGWGFGLHEALDQIGALLGPLLIFLLLFFKFSYQASFAILLIPALIALFILRAAKYFYPHPQHFEITPPKLVGQKLNRSFWIYIAAVSFIGAGYADFALIAYHFQKTGELSKIWIPLFYAFAMGVDGLSALVMGRLFDMKGVSLLIPITFLASFFAPLAFSANFYAALIGILLWGIGLGAQESIMRASVAALVPSHQRGSAYGILNLFFGIFWFLGSVIMGALYDISPIYLVIFSMVAQLASLPFFFKIKNITHENAGS
jgi:MFS family permease